MHVIGIMVACGGDRDRYRDVASDAISRLRQVFESDWNRAATIIEWDYRRAPPEVVRAGGLATTSLLNVDRSDALIAILGKRVPTITRLEIRRAFESRRSGIPKAIFVFANPSLWTRKHDELNAELEAEYGEGFIYAPYQDRMTFQASLYTSLFRFLFERLAVSNPPLISPETS